MRMNNRKRCEWVMDDGFKCNRYYTTGSRVNTNSKYCEEHSTLNLASGLVRSSNVFTQGGNDIKMREWVMNEMNNTNRHGKLIRNMTRRLDTMWKSLEDEERWEKLIEKTMTRMLEEGEITSKQLTRLETMIMRVHNKMLALESRVDLKEAPSDFTKLEFGQEEE